eukprot:Hpha_TRINITY_DN5457_c0_g1::TRINITY_DN5457_c0_g1_i1::g.192333::m.192333
MAVSSLPLVLLAVCVAAGGAAAGDVPGPPGWMGPRPPGVHDSACDRDCAMVGLSVGVPLVCICKLIVLIYFLRERQKWRQAEDAEKRYKKQRAMQREAKKAGSKDPESKAEYHAMPADEPRRYSEDSTGEGGRLDV